MTIIIWMLASIITIGTAITAVYDMGVRRGWWSDDMPDWFA